ncbi:uncharacterized protein PV06_07989 [Exophiala oligosperma]|uniref:Uncharacterized protein n=1 Tax=Exophiala oligosperma TaxID=215243 RepID=A0A0D2BTM8_9EURO|nr:uncharacterized protein PV06_07989 [Exophiala oligosperma]KIW40817.1 hypothetical protein PV06_07989 [Exophiala oligosperma]
MISMDKISSTTTAATIISAWPYVWAYVYSFMLLSIALATFTPAAHHVAERAGFPQPRDRPLNVYVYLLAGSQLMIGLSVAVLVFLGDWKAVSVVIACSTPMGLIGTTLSARTPSTGGGGGIIGNKPFWSHAMMVTIGTCAAWRLIKENW